MSVENLPLVEVPDFGNVVDPDRPTLSFEWQVQAPHRTPGHSHPRGHVIYAEAGSIWVVTTDGNWLVPAGLAIWIPPHIEHELHSHGPVVARLLFIDPSYAAALPGHCGTLKVNRLLEALLERAVAYGNAYAREGPAARLAQVMLDELAEMEFAPLFLPISKEPRLARVMQRLIDDPESSGSLEDMAREAGASPRTLARLFRAETGMSFGQWRTNRRLIESIMRLEKGASVTEVALDLGYGSTSSFVYMFRKHLGIPPGRYRNEAVAG
ncbi:MAG: helix-turn-helix transcriptional regulator [Alphaproteobacteria bacterium]|nr:helix-turn-helix transcriptional regulator [Alphaproteobacteria bacterium]MCB9928175.1 helix-turn-helix transcriptional regulator [Alphaproteobacteria bacterium]